MSLVAPINCLSIVSYPFCTINCPLNCLLILYVVFSVKLTILSYQVLICPWLVYLLFAYPFCCIKLSIITVFIFELSVVALSCDLFSFLPYQVLSYPLLSYQVLSCPWLSYLVFTYSFVLSSVHLYFHIQF